MTIYTKTGDDGETGLLGGGRVPKDDPRIVLVGEIDELSSHLGLIKSRMDNADTAAQLAQVQKTLIKLMAGLSDAGNPTFFLNEPDVALLEKQADALQAHCPSPIKDGFVLPGENELSATIDIARTVARRAERTMIAVDRQHPVDPAAKKYLNRLSDYLYLLARHTDLVTKITESVRQAIKPKSESIKNNNPRGLTLENAKAVAAEIEKKARAMGLSAVVTIVGADGNPVLSHVMDGAYLVSYEVAMHKAYTAAALKMPTEALNALAQPGEMFYGIESLKNERITVIGGGVLLTRHGAIAGALGVSGGTDKEDIVLAQYGKEFFERALQ